MKNKIKTKTKIHFCFHFRFCFHFVFHFRFCFHFCFHSGFGFCFHFGFCFCFHFRFSFCFRFYLFIYLFIFLFLFLNFTMASLGHHTVLQKGVLTNFVKFTRKREIPAQIFCCEFCEISQNIFFKEPQERLLQHNHSFCLLSHDDLLHIFWLSIFSV